MAMINTNTIIVLLPCVMPSVNKYVLRNLLSFVADHKNKTEHKSVGMVIFSSGVFMKAIMLAAKSHLFYTRIKLLI